MIFPQVLDTIRIIIMVKAVAVYCWMVYSVVAMRATSWTVPTAQV